MMRLLLILLLLVLSCLSLITGAMPFSLQHLWQGDEVTQLVLWEVRLPRLCVVLISGFSLGLAGAVVQGVTRNPLAEPGVLGVSAGAALGAVLAYYFSGGMGWLVPVAAIAGAALVAGCAVWLGGLRTSAETLLLAGIALSSLCGAVVALTLNLLPNPFAVADITFWLMGSAADRGWEHVAFLTPFSLLGWVLLLYDRRFLTSLGLGDEVAQTMGVPLSALRVRMVAGTACVVGASVAVMGAVGFIGLIVPHLMRRLQGAHPGRLVWPSALGGAALLLIADMLVRVLPASMGEIKVGVVTALIGAPFFLMLVLRQKGGGICFT